MSAPELYLDVVEALSGVARLPEFEDLDPHAKGLLQEATERYEIRTAIAEGEARHAREASRALASRNRDLEAELNRARRELEHAYALAYTARPGDLDYG